MSAPAPAQMRCLPGLRWFSSGAVVKTYLQLGGWGPKTMNGCPSHMASSVQLMPPHDAATNVIVMRWVADPDVGRMERLWVSAAAGDVPSAMSERTKAAAGSSGPMTRRDIVMRR